MRSPRSSSAKGFDREIRERLTDSIRTKERVLEKLVPAIERAARLLIDALEGGHKILLFGNGGSAADSQHIAAELVGKLIVKRRALAAIALTTDTSNLTALANDFGYDTIFARQVEALGQAGDVAVGISTSGHSPNVLAAIQAAHERGLKTVALTGRDGGPLGRMADLAITIPSDSTQRIQESHITIGHILCELVESHFSG
ncbi:MAG: D-sedoheptulose 7-phosphate isomerase [Candidatus Omnitrophica bacterium]|nr:D-sedoheptulose 7-phosphate isomerase [Candidatus Omnitrophota bacterium]